MNADSMMAGRVVVARPDGTERGRLAVDIVGALARARALGAPACLLRPPVIADEALFSLVPAGIALVPPHGIAGAVHRSRWRLSRAARDARTHAARAASTFWREWYRELRRHVGDERLPIDLRGRLRGAAQRAFARAAGRDADGQAARFPRTWLRERIDVRLPQDLADRARAAAEKRGFAAPRLVAIDVREHVAGFDDMLRLLAAHEYTPAVLDGTMPLVDAFVLLTCRFLICDTSDAQRAAYLTNTPTLFLNATDAFAGYPIRDDGVYVLKMPVDLDSGRTIPGGEALTEAYYRNLRNIGFRGASRNDVLSAVQEMLTSVQRGWSDTPGQQHYRARVVEAGDALAPRVHHVAKWGPVDGFIGDGRIAAVQAERA